MYDIFDEEYIRRVREKEIREEAYEEGFREGFKEGIRKGYEKGINNVIAVLSEAGIDEDVIRDIAEMSRKQLELSQ